MKPLLILFTLLLTGCVSIDLSNLVDQELAEITLQKAQNSFTRERIALIDVSGMITNQKRRRSGGTFTPDDMKSILNKIEADKHIKAVVLRIDSPGGNVTATDLIYHDLKTFKEKTGLPIFAICMGISASGGYYIANAADEIHALPTSITGSIGVIASFPKLQSLADKVGYQQVVIKSGKLKDLGNPLREMTKEEQALFQKMINDMYNKFLNAVAQGRPKLDVKALRPLADGRIYTAQQALENNLIDGIYYLDDTLEKAKTAAGVEDASIITYSARRPDNPTIYSNAQSQKFDFQLLDINLPNLGKPLTTGFYYLWAPGQ